MPARPIWVLVTLVLPVLAPSDGRLRAEATPPLPPAFVRIAATLPDTAARDADRRIRARRLVRRLLVAYYRRHTPAGMAFFSGKVVFERGHVRMEGGFYLGLRETSTGRFLDFRRRAGLGGGDRDGRLARWRGADPDLPVVQVSLVEARACAVAQGARLPTRAELLAAATTGGRYRYPWGDRFDPLRVNSLETGLGHPEPVGYRKEGRSALGILNLLGNVAEWTESIAGRRRGRDAHYYVVGGSYRTPCRYKRFVTYRLHSTADLPDVGFRLAKSLPPLPAAIAPPAAPRAP